MKWRILVRLTGRLWDWLLPKALILEEKVKGRRPYTSLQSICLLLLSLFIKLMHKTRVRLDVRSDREVFMATLLKVDEHAKRAEERKVLSRSQRLVEFVETYISRLSAALYRTYLLLKSGLSIKPRPFDPLSESQRYIADEWYMIIWKAEVHCLLFVIPAVCMHFWFVYWWYKFVRKSSELTPPSRMSHLIETIAYSIFLHIFFLIRDFWVGVIVPWWCRLPSGLRRWFVLLWLYCVLIVSSIYNMIAACSPISLHQILTQSFVKAFVDSPERLIRKKCITYLQPAHIMRKRRLYKFRTQWIEKLLYRRRKRAQKKELYSMRNFAYYAFVPLFKFLCYIFFLPFPEYVKSRSVLWAMLQGNFLDVTQSDYSLYPLRRADVAMAFLVFDIGLSILMEYSETGDAEDLHRAFVQDVWSLRSIYLSRFSSYKKWLPVVTKSLSYPLVSKVLGMLVFIVYCGFNIFYNIFSILCACLRIIFWLIVRIPVMLGMYYYSTLVNAYRRLAANFGKVVASISLFLVRSCVALTLIVFIGGCIDLVLTFVIWGHGLGGLSALIFSLIPYQKAPVIFGYILLSFGITWFPLYLWSKISYDGQMLYHEVGSYTIIFSTIGLFLCLFYLDPYFGIDLRYGKKVLFYLPFLEESIYYWADGYSED